MLSTNMLSPAELNLGCGTKRRENCVNVDRAESVQPDVVWDLDQYPYPFQESRFERVFAHDIIEHVRSIPEFISEVHRISKSSAVVEITTPHFSCANSFTDPTHLHHLGFFSFDYFTAEHELNFYTGARFEMLERMIVFNHSWANRIVARLANRYPAAYERRFAWIFPAWFMIFRLRVVK